MAITVEEKWDSREVGTDSAERRFIVRGTDDGPTAKVALDSVIPVLYAGLAYQHSRVERIAEEIWEGTVRYGQIERPETGDSSYQFDTGGGTQHITHSRQTVARYAPAGETAPDFKGAIGVTEDSVEGVDIAFPTYNFSETHYIADTAVTGAYKATLFSLTGTVNDAPFKGFAAGEVLFLGASGSKRGQEDWEITFRFAASPNAINLTVGEMTGIAKKGWEYLWVRYADDVDDVASELVKRPTAVYVEQVYPTGNFAGLGIGT